jgi:putative membrane protein
MRQETIYGDLDGDGVLSATERSAVGSLRTIYLTILISHIILAAGVLPLILLSFYRGLQMQVEKHKKLVRWTFPIWLYVTVTGVIVYILIRPYYHF